MSVQVHAEDREGVVEVERNDFAGDQGQWVQLMGKDIQFQRIRILPSVPIAEVGVIVKCNLKGYFYSMENMKRLLDEPFEVLENQYFQVGEADAIPGLELALRHSRKGEQMRAICTAKFAFGGHGRGISTKPNGTSSSGLVVEKTKTGLAVVPPSMDLEYEIDVLDHLNERQLHQHIVSKYQHELKAVEDDEAAKDKLVHRLYTIQSMTYRKEAGNRWFSFEDFDRSARAYSSATKIAEGYFNSGSSNTVLDEDMGMEERIKAIEEKERQKEAPVSEDDSEVVGLYVTCLNNLAACKLSKGEYALTKELCVKVLQFSPFNGKALLRAAKATLALDAFEECELCLKRLLSIEQLDDNLKNSGKLELAKLRKALADYKSKVKQMQQKMANKLFNGGKEKKEPIEVETISPEPISEASKSVEAPPVASSPKEAVVVADVKLPAEAAPEKKVEDVKADSSSSNTTTKEKVAAPAKGGGNNMMLLVATSLIVVVVSLVLAYVNR